MSFRRIGSSILWSAGSSLAILVAIARPGLAEVMAVELAPTKDNTLYEEGSNLSNGAGDYFFAGHNGRGEAHRALIAFDIASAIPAGSTINSVQLQLRMSRTLAGSEAVRLHRVTRDWGEAGSNAGGEEGAGALAQPGDATWSHALFNTVAWTTPGGDFAPTQSGSANVGGIGNYLWGSTAGMVADVQAWLDAPATNFGWILIGDETTDTTDKRFDSRTHPTAANRPRLTVDFTPPMTPAARTTWGSIKALYR